MKMDEILQGLTEEQKEAAKNLKTPEEAKAFLKENNIKLSEEQLRAVSGGMDIWSCRCRSDVES
jgi:hypothetical protein